MISMTEPVFVDTNIFVYARDAGEHVKQAAAEQWIRRLWIEQRGRTSTQVLSEFYTTVTRKLTPGIDRDRAWQDVLALLAWEPRDIDRDLLVRAQDIERRFNLSWWDSLIVAAAQSQGCPILLSEDFQNGMRFDETTVVNPFTTSIAEARASYPAAKPMSRHRSRGRPARTKAPASP
jgi:predicted nucleic acid-binding protein